MILFSLFTLYRVLDKSVGYEIPDPQFCTFLELDYCPHQEVSDGPFDNTWGDFYFFHNFTMFRVYGFP